MVAGVDPKSGEANQSYADGVMNVMINDGAGRVIETMDNVGAGSTGSRLRRSADAQPRNLQRPGFAGLAILL